MSNNRVYKTRVRLKNDTAANWGKLTNFIPLSGEIIIYSDLNKIKIGDGTTKLSSLSFVSSEIEPIIANITITDMTGDNSYKGFSDKTENEIALAASQGRAIYLSAPALNAMVPLSFYSAETGAVFSASINENATVLEAVIKDGNNAKAVLIQNDNALYWLTF